MRVEVEIADCDFNLQPECIDRSPTVMMSVVVIVMRVIVMTAMMVHAVLFRKDAAVMTREGVACIGAGAGIVVGAAAIVPAGVCHSRTQSCERESK